MTGPSDDRAVDRIGMTGRWVRPAEGDCPKRADVAELADAQASGACARKGVEVRLLSSAVKTEKAVGRNPDCLFLWCAGHGAKTWRCKSSGSPDRGYP